MSTVSGYGVPRASVQGKIVVPSLKSRGAAPVPHSQLSAAHYFQRRVRHGRGTSRHHHLLGTLLAAADKHSDAREHFLTATQLEPSNGAARNDLGLAMLRSADVKGAVGQFQAALAQNEEAPILHINLAATYARKGRYAEAIKHTKRALELDPSNIMAHRNLARLMEQIGNSKRAVVHYTAAVDHARTKGQSSSKEHAFALRRMAVHNVIDGTVTLKDAQDLMDEARVIDGTPVTLPTTEKTNDIAEAVMLQSRTKRQTLKRIETASTQQQQQQQQDVYSDMGSARSVSRFGL